MFFYTMKMPGLALGMIGETSSGPPLHYHFIHPVLIIPDFFKQALLLWHIKVFQPLAWTEEVLAHGSK
jgi:hypothetical protein